VKPLTRKLSMITLVALSSALAGCPGKSSAPPAEINTAAALTGSLPADPLSWRVITSSSDPAAHTMSTLFGNDAAVTYARSNSAHDYPAGSQIALVTWTQREDPRWYGANIPSIVQSIEFVTVTAATNGTPSYAYEKYQGQPLQKAASDSTSDLQRISFLVSQRSSVFP
jgi:hypothetical protein